MNKRKTAKKITAALLVVCLALAFAAVITPQAQAAGLNFISINDTLIDYAYAYYSGSSVYVPATLFSYFGIYYSYFQDSQTAALVTNSIQIYFELESGNTYDSADNYYSAQAYYLYGTVYVPVGFMCSTFGLSWSTITGSSYGSIVRIKNSSVVLSDDQFLSAATLSMQSMYNAYYGITSPTPGTSVPVTSAPTETPEVTPTESPSPTPTPDRSDTSVYLCFAGLPDEQLARSLSARGYPAAFFLTSEQVSAEPDTVRALVVDGFAIGVWFEDEQGYADAAEEIRKRTGISTLLVTSSPENAQLCREFAQENSLVYWNCGVTAQPEQDGEMISSPVPYTSQIELERLRADVLIDLEQTETAAAISVLTYLATNRFTVAEVRETTAPEV